VKKVLIQLDTDPQPSPFDSIAATDAGVDVLLRHGEVAPEDVRGLVGGAIFTRGPDDLHNTAVWVGGSNVPTGEEVLGQVQKSFFGPFKVSVMLDSNGCNTTAAAMVARIAKRIDLDGKRAVIVGVGPVGVRSGLLLEQEGCEVLAITIPADVLGTDSYRRPRGLKVAQERGLTTQEPEDRKDMEAALEGAHIAIASGPAGVEVLPEESWSSNPSIELLADCNATEPLGLGGTEAMDDFEERHGKLILGALAIGGTKMKTHRTCVQRLFESNDVVMDVDGVYAVAKELA
jgi:methylenetetrahydrofolate/methylenetetrahydromethanopterin dehydrogenase (NADP+)